MSTPYDETYPMKVHLIKDDTKEKAYEIVSVPQTFPLTLNAVPVMILPHARKRRHAQIIINGTGMVAIGRSQSDCQSAQNNLAGESTGNVMIINGAEFTAAYSVIGHSELWAAMISASEPAAMYPAIIAPGFPASGTAIQNTNNFPVTVIINANGASITNVTVNGITVGTGAGTYIIPAAGTISVTYTVAIPTWTWAFTAPPLPVIATTIAVIKETE
jgi:hypothetical protein